MKQHWEVLKKFSFLFKQENKLKLITALGAIGIILIFFSGSKPNSKEQKQIQNTFDEYEYITDLEGRITSIVESINGVGKAKVMLSLETTESFKFATEERHQTDVSQDIKTDDEQRLSERTDSENKFIIVEDDNGNKKALVETSYTPQIKGAVVVCSGGDSSAVKNRVTQALTTILGIGSSKVCVIKG